MVKTSNLGLIAWDREEDDFDHSQLANNWVAIDGHDHTGPPRGKQLGSESLKDRSIIRSKIGDRAVGSEQIGIGAVGSDQIEDGGIHNSDLGDESVSGAKILDATITTDKLDPNVIPLGTIILWYRKEGSGTQPEGGWEVVDGRPWSSVPNAMGYTTGNMPDLRGHFARGSEISEVGQTGGSASANVAHAHNVNAHSHTTADHAHAFGIGTDGSHRHGFGSSPHQLFQRITKYQQVSGHEELQSLWDTFTNSSGETEVPMEITGGHNHGGGGVTSGTGTHQTSSDGATTDSQLGSISTVPPYVNVLHIMRVR